VSSCLRQSLSKSFRWSSHAFCALRPSSPVHLIFVRQASQVKTAPGYVSAIGTENSCPHFGHTIGTGICIPVSFCDVFFPFFIMDPGAGIFQTAHEQARTWETPNDEKRAVIHESPKYQERATHNERPIKRERASISETSYRQERAMCTEIPIVIERANAREAPRISERATIAEMPMTAERAKVSETTIIVERVTETANAK